MLLIGPDARMSVVLDGGVFGGQAEGIPAHGMEDVEAAHALYAGDDVADGVIAHVPHVHACRRDTAAFPGRNIWALRDRLRFRTRGLRPSAFATWLRSVVGCSPPRLAIPSCSCAISWTSRLLSLRGLRMLSVRSRELLRLRGFLRLALAILRCRVIFFLMAAVSIEKPFSAGGACSLRPASSHSLATLRRSSPGSSMGVSSEKRAPGQAFGRGSRRVWDASGSARKASAPILPLPMFSWRSTRPPSGILESLTWKTGTRSRPMVCVDQFDRGGRGRFRS